MQNLGGKLFVTHSGMVSLLGQEDKLTPPKVWLSSLDFEYIKLTNIATDHPVSISPGLIPRRLRRIRIECSTKRGDALRRRVSFLHEYLDP